MKNSAKILCLLLAWQGLTGCSRSTSSPSINETKPDYSAGFTGSYNFDPTDPATISGQQITGILAECINNDTHKPVAKELCASLVAPIKYICSAEGGEMQDMPCPVARVFTASLKFSTGGGRACATDGSGTLKCWGNNGYGQLGDDTLVSRSTPAKVLGNSIFEDVATGGGHHTCGIVFGGVLKCWGDNTYGQLGTGSTDLIGSASSVSGDLSFIQVSTGRDHTCAITSANKLKCWGRNQYGQLGNNTNTGAATPISIDSDFDYSSVSASYDHTCGITTAGVLKCWGSNNRGQLGNDSADDSLLPVIIDSGTQYQQVSAGLDHTCGITSSSFAKCWGSNANGKLGVSWINTSPIWINSSLIPKDVAEFGSSYFEIPGLPILLHIVQDRYTKISVGLNHTCAINTANKLKCWGGNQEGELGTNSTTPSNSPIEVDSSVSYTNVSVSEKLTCASTAANILKCWGANYSGVLTGALPLSFNFPQTLLDGSFYTNGLGETVYLPFNSIDISVGGDTSCLETLTTNGSFVWKCWGQNQSGQLGIGTSLSSSIPVNVSNQVDKSPYYLISTSESTTCGIKYNSAGWMELFCWGADYSGNTIYSPTLFASGDFNKLSVGNNHGCVVEFNGQLQCWGDNTYGQLGAITNITPDPSDPSAPTFVKIDSSPTTLVTIDDSNSDQFGQSIGPKYTQVSVGLNHTCGITELGVLKCWGDNSNYQLGNNDQINYPYPQVIDYGTSYSQVSAGDNFTCGITTDKILKCWGAIVVNGLSLSEPTIMDEGSLYLQISAGSHHICGIDARGGLRCFGENSSGQLGDKTNVSSTGTLGVNVLDETWTNVDGSTISSSQPARLVKYQKVSAGRDHTCGITAEDEGMMLKCWGGNNFGGLGIGGLLNSPIPMPTSFAY